MLGQSSPLSAVLARRSLRALVCALAFAPAAVAQSVQLSSSRQTTVGDVARHLSSPDGQWVVYLADQDTDGVRELYSVPADGSAAPLKLNGPQTTGSVGTSSGLVEITPDSTRVLYGANDAVSGLFSLYVVPITGGASTKLSATALDSNGRVPPFLIAPDGSRVVYSSGYRLFSVAITGGPAVQLAQRLQIPTGHGTSSYGTYALAPDSSRVVFSSDETGEFVLRLYSCPLTGGAPALLSNSTNLTSEKFAFHPDGVRVLFVTARQLHSTRLDGAGKAIALTPLHDRIVSFALDPLGERVAYIAFDNATGRDLYSARIPPARLRVSGTPNETRLTPAVAWGRTLFQFRIDPAGERVVYQTDQDVEGSMELFSVPLTGGVPTRLDPAPLGLGAVIDFELSSDGATVFYKADVTGDGPYHLFRVPSAGGASTQLSPALVSGGTLLEFEPCAPAGRLVYRADQDSDEVQELYSVPEGGGAVVRLNPPLFATRNVQEFALTVDGRVLYLADADENDALELFSVSAAGGPVVELNGALVQAEVDEITHFLPGATSAEVVYLADEDTDEFPELYAAPLDGSAPSVKLGPAPNFLGKVMSYQATPDGSSLVVLATNPTIGELFRVAIDGSTPPLRIVTPPGSFGLATFALSPDGERVAYFASSGSDRDLYAAPTDGSLVSTRLDDGLEDPKSFWIVAGARAVYLSTLSGYRLMSISLDGGTRVQLSPALPSGRFIENVRFTPDLTRLVFRADVDLDGVSELYGAPVDGSAPAVKLNTPLTTDQDVYPEFELSPDGTLVVYAADVAPTTSLQLYAAPVDGSAAPVKLSGTLAVHSGAVTSRPIFQLSADSAHVVFVRSGSTELYVAPLDGSTAPLLLSAPMVSGGQLRTSGEWPPYAISPDGARVAYVASQEQSGVYELYVVPLDASAAPLKLSPTPPVSNRDVLVSQRNFADGAAPGLRFRADGLSIAYLVASSQFTELYESKVDGSTPARRLHPALVAGGSVDFFDLHGNHALYLADQETDEVFELHASELD
ncbi:MAG: hypothetical protein ABL998_00065 [Planctomycetota bacterium]